MTGVVQHTPKATKTPATSPALEQYRRLSVAFDMT
jgi:hypothetical protein